MRLKTRYKLGLIAWAYLVVLLTVSSMPFFKSQEMPVWREIAHNLCHVPAYFFLVWILLLHMQRQSSPWWLYAGSGLVSFLYGLANEYVQTFVPGRQFSWMDILLNSIGITLGLYCFYKRKSSRGLRNAINTMS